jgi:cellulose biosynthesis protein BcsQ
VTTFGKHLYPINVIQIKGKVLLIDLSISANLITLLGVNRRRNNFLDVVIGDLERKTFDQIWSYA